MICISGIYCTRPSSQPDPFPVWSRCGQLGSEELDQFGRSSVLYAKSPVGLSAAITNAELTVEYQTGTCLEKEVFLKKNELEDLLFTTSDIIE